MSRRFKLFRIVAEPGRIFFYLLGIKIGEIEQNYHQFQHRQMLNYLAYFKARIFFLQHYGIQIPSECCGLGNKFELVYRKLKDLKREFYGQIYPLEQCSQFKYLQTRNPKIYEQYIQKHIEKGWTTSDVVWNIDRLLSLESSMAKSGYDTSKNIIAINQANTILDGTHRSCILYYMYGPDHEIPVVKVSYTD